MSETRDHSETPPEPAPAEPAEPRLQPSMDGLRGALRRTALRVRAQRALDAATLFALVGLGIAGLVVAFLKTEALHESEAPTWLALACALPLLAAVIGFARPLPPLLAAQLLDRAHGLKDRITNAVSFGGETEPTPFMRAAIRDAVAHAEGLSAARAMPFKLPVELVGVAGVALGVGLLAMVEVPRTVEERIFSAGIDPVQLHADDLDAYESGIRELLDDPETDDGVRAAAREFNRIIEDLADERLDREESLRRIADLERQLRDTRPADGELMRESLQELGEDLRRSSLANELSAALREADAERAQSEMRRLAEEVRQDPRRRDLEALRRALERAAERRAEDRSQELERREEEMRRLLRRQREENTEPQESQRRLLQRRRRELDRLREEHQRAMERSRQLDRLRRELQRSAESLQRDQRDQAAESLDRSAEDLNRMARQQMSEEEMQRMQQQLEQLRELIRRQRQQQAQGGQQGQQRGQGQRGQGSQGQGQMDRFVLRARGQGDGEGTPLGVPGQGGQQGQQQGQQGQGQGQQGQGQGQGQNGQEQRMLTLGGGGESNAILEIPGMGGGQQQAGGQGPGRAQMGPGAGTGHDDDPTRTQGNQRTVRVEGEQRDGPSTSEVIMSSAQRGFANRPYRDTYVEYNGHAEEVLERDEIPPGRRFFVRRYFQLIRPREGAPSSRTDGTASDETE